MGNEKLFSKSDRERNKISLPKVKPGVKGGIGNWAWIEGGFDDLKRKVKRSKGSN